MAMFGTFAIFSVAYSFSNLFINVYIWKHQSSLMNVGWFQLWSFLFVFIGFLLGALIIRKIGSRVNFLCSSVSALGLYGYLITGEIHNLVQIGGAGVLNGLYIGLFYSGLNFYTLWFSERKDLSKVISLQYMIHGIAQMVTPPIAGWFIHTKGYSETFTIALGILIVQTLLSSATPQVRIRSHFRKTGFFIPGNRQMGYIGLSTASFGFFYAFVHMSISVFVYLFLQDEWALGEWNMIFALISVVTYYFLGKILKQSHREIFATLGVIGSTVITLTLFFPYPAYFVVFNAVISVFLPMMWVPVYTNHYDTIKQQVTRSEVNPLAKMMELLVFREFSLCVGRIAFLLLLLGSISWGRNNPMYIVLIFLCFMPSALFILSRNASRK
jgi:YQGE family putative transporter